MAKTPFDTSKNDGIVGSNEDDLLFKPNPDMLVSKIDQTEKVDDTHCFQCIIEWMFLFPNSSFSKRDELTGERWYISSSYDSTGSHG